VPLASTFAVLAIAACVAIAAAGTKALTWGGALAAFAVGGCAFGFLGIAGAATLFAFFLPATLLSRFGRSRKLRLSDVPKGGPRNAKQVLANGGIAAACAVLALRWPVMIPAFAGAFAAASADTWATEIGTIAKGAPRSIVSWRPIATGLSGGVTLPGTLAEVAGAGCVAFAAAAFGLVPFWIALVAGIAGATVDSVLGATWQGLRHCAACGRNCETDPHACGTSTRVVRGFGWLGNDLVNFAATGAGAAVALVAVFLF
jgi:uncharacterized protein (TIGR00297 family)